jgi:hypothetical protein
LKRFLFVKQILPKRNNDDNNVIRCSLTLTKSCWNRNGKSKIKETELRADELKV